MKCILKEQVWQTISTITVCFGEDEIEYIELGLRSFPLREAYLFFIFFQVGPRLCHHHDAGPMWHVVSVSYSGIQYSGFPLHWLQKYRWARSRWTCHSQHLQDPNSQRGKGKKKQKKLKDRGSFVVRSCAVPPGELSAEGETQCRPRTHGEKDKLLQNVTTTCFPPKQLIYVLFI